MQSIIKTTIAASFAGLVLLISSIGSFYLYSLYPRAHELNNLIQSASSEDRRPPKAMLHLLEITNQQSIPDLYIARYYTLDDMRGLKRHLNTYFFMTFLRLQYNYDERMTMFSSLAYTGSGRHGMNNTALALFHKPLSQLSLKELAEIVVRIKTPSRDEQAILESRDKILERLDLHE